jgi:hypothetical protein
MKSASNVVILIIVLFGLGFLYRRFENKRLREEDNYSSEAIQNYLLDDVTLGKSKRPVLWLHIPYEQNSSNWLSFGSRNSLELNQPYLFLTVRSIIQKCDKSFTICMIDDQSFQKLIPEFKIDMTKISSPILENVRRLGMMKLLHKYGGLVCPLSLLCFQDLKGLYEKGTNNDKMFLCENLNKNTTSSNFDFYPSLDFCGAPKGNRMLKELIDFMQRTVSTDFTAQSHFQGDFDRWCNTKISQKRINFISGIYVGVKTVEDTPIKLEDLLSNHYLNLYPQTYGIWIPAKEIQSRRKYEWFSRLSQKQVLESDTILGNYLLVNLGKEGNILEPVESNPDWVGFWKTPNVPILYGLKPGNLGDNVQRKQFTEK